MNIVNAPDLLASIIPYRSGEPVGFAHIVSETAHPPRPLYCCFFVILHCKKCLLATPVSFASEDDLNAKHLTREAYRKGRCANCCERMSDQYPEMTEYDKEEKTNINPAMDLAK